MLRFACAAVLLSGCSQDPPEAELEPEPTGERFARECLTGAVAGELISLNWEELFVTWGCGGTWGEGASWERSLFGLTGCCDFPFAVELLRVQDGWGMAIHDDRRTLVQFGAGFPQTRFEHTLDDVVRFDFDGNGTRDYITSGDGIVRRGVVPAYMYDAVAASDETTLLTGKPYRYLTIADLGGSALPDIFFTTKSGELGLAVQTSPDQFTERTLGHGENPQRPYVADVDGDGRDDIVGASPEIFVYSSKTQTLVQLPDKARAIAVGDVDGDGLYEPVFLTENGLQVRRIVGLDTADTPVSKVVLNTTEAQTLTLADVDGDLWSDVALIHELGQATSWLELRRSPSFP